MATASKAKRKRKQTPVVDEVRIVEHPECLGGDSCERVYCPECESAINGGNVVSGVPLFCSIEQARTITRCAYCSHCDHVLMWIQHADIEGTPTGRPIDDTLKIFRGRDYINTFLRSYPEARGVQQV